MGKPEIRIKTDGITGTKIFVDGKELEGVIGFEFKQSYRKKQGIPVLQIEMKATNVTLDSKLIPKLPEPFSSFYTSNDGIS